MAILVAGGAGYIGSHTALALREKNEEVVYLDNLSKGHRGAVLGGKLYQVDLRDTDALRTVFEENEIEAVIDFAAFSLVGESVGEPLKYYENNVGATVNLLQVMREYGVKKIVFSSTAATYGEPENTPILESDRTEPTNPYGETKLAVEKALKWADNAYGIKYVSLRYFNAAGAHQSGKIGEDHAPETHLIPLILDAALGKRDAISIFGTDYPTEDGTCVRDYIHVTDLADAHILAVEKLRKDNTSAIYNLGNGKGFSVRQVIDVAKQVTGLPIKVIEAERRAGDPAVLIASSDKIKRELGWNPRFCGLSTIVETAFRWHQGHPDGFAESANRQ